MFRFVNGLPESEVGSAIGRGDEFIEDGGEPGGPPVEVEGRKDFDAVANAVPVVGSTLEGDLGDAADALDGKFEVTFVRVHEGDFASRFDCGSAGGKLARQGFI